MNCRPAIVLVTALFSSCSSPPTGPTLASRIELVSGGGQQGVAGYLLPEPVTLKVVDERGNPVRGVELAATSSAPLATVESDDWTTDDQGLVTLRWRMGASYDGETIAITSRDGTLERFTVTALGGTRRVRKIAGGLAVYCAITLEERLGCWRPLPVEHSFHVAPGQPPTIDYRPDSERYLDVAIGAPGHREGISGCAIRSDGSVSCFAEGSWVNSLAGIGGEAGFTQIFANHSEASRFYCALKPDGEAWCWGDNSNHQLGTGTPGDAELPGRVDTQTRFTTLALGDHHGCGLDSGGGAWCWGHNGSGATGIGTHEGDALTPTPVVTPLKFLSLRILAGSQTCGLTSQGEWWCWGTGFHSGAHETETEPVRSMIPVGALLATPDQVALVSDPAGNASWWGDLYPTLDLVVATTPRAVTVPFQVPQFAPAVKDQAACADVDGQGSWLCIDLLWLWYGDPDDESGSLGAKPLVHGVP